jgi:acetate kinase
MDDRGRNILVLNSGSSSLKYALLLVQDREPTRRVRGGKLEMAGRERAGSFVSSGITKPLDTVFSGHDDAARAVLDSLTHDRIDAVGFRVVHGGANLFEPVVIDQNVVAAIDDAREFAPLHNDGALRAIRACRAALDEKTPLVAVFDTGFHRTIPRFASDYAIPSILADKYAIRRYGFHGIAHQHMSERARESGRGRSSKIVTLQLGNGCSACAVLDGVSVDTSMGFSPLEGLIMGTRSGDIDPAVLEYLARRTGTSAEQVLHTLNHESGLKGVAGTSDMRMLQQSAESGDERAQLAIEMFCYRVRKYVGAYAAVLGGLDALVFGGGIGENAPLVREEICRPLGWLGVELDRAANAATIGAGAVITKPASKICVSVVPVDEELVIARETAKLISGT